ncbi:MAG: hypothetical protein M3Q09_11910, partial [Gemmatimonadota bacterium]|nr:hypothetical protein [Gemmatimonadota bacterium]
RDGGALLLSGTSGQGKSTLTTYLCQHGWRYMSDDVAPLRMDVNVVLPFPQSPVRRLHPGREVSRDELGTLERETVAVTSVQICHEPTEIRGIVFIAYAKGRKAELVRLEQGSGAMELLRNATNFFDHKASAVAKAAELGRRIPMYSLDYGIPGPAAELLNGLW